MSDYTNFYEVLEIAVDADFESIRKAYMRAKKSFTADSMTAYSLFNEEELKTIQESVEQAFFVLGDPSRRKAYDEARGIVSKFSMPKTEASGFIPRPKIVQPAEKPPVEDKIGLSDKKTTGFGGAPDAFFISKSQLDSSYDKDTEIEDWIRTCEEFGGEAFTRIREYKKISLDQLSEFSKISKRHIENIEKENFGELPAVPYLRGFVVQIAKALKIDAERAAKSYMERYSKIKTR